MVANLGPRTGAAKVPHEKLIGCNMTLALDSLTKGRLSVRLAQGGAEVEAAIDLRRRCFRSLRGLPPEAEGDVFDALSEHLLIQEGDATLATCRLRLLGAKDLGGSYTGQFYDLSALSPLPALELGRFCQAPEVADPDPLRLTFAALTRLVDASGAGLLLGCSSFEGSDFAPHLSALAPWRHRLRTDTPACAAETLSLRHAPTGSHAPLPPLLRHYLALGAELSDHAVVDRALNTCHVLTVLQVAAIPAARARALRALADS